MVKVLISVSVGAGIALIAGLSGTLSKNGLMACLAIIAAVTLWAALARYHRKRLEGPDLQEVIRAIPAPVAIYDHAERLVIYNDLYREHHQRGLMKWRDSGYRERPTYKELVLAGAPDALSADEREAYWEERVLQQPPPDGRFIERKLPGIGWLRIAHRPLPSGGSVRLAIDVNEVKNKRSDLEVALSRAQDAEFAQSKFMANMSHELRTPLNGVLGMVSLMRQNQTRSGPQARQLDVIESSGRHLLALITQILEYAKMEAHPDLPGEKLVFDMPGLLSDVVDAAVAASPHRGARVSVDTAPDVYPNRLSCPIQVRQIATNLVENALKFAPDDPVEIRLTEPVAGRVRVEVEDAGPGIPASDAEMIFTKFYQRSSGVTRSHGGVGLGLAISRKLVEAMGGKIGVMTGRQGGALFWFEINAPAASPQSIE